MRNSLRACLANCFSHVEMTAVTIPTCFEANLTLGDGSAGADVSEVLQLASNQVPNLYSSSSSQFSYCFQV